MDLFTPFLICFIFSILFCVCSWCCKRKREGVIYGFGGQSVTVATQHVSQSPVVVPPYPVVPHHPVPHAGAPAPGFSTAGNYPSAQPYHQTVPVCYPPPIGSAPYPTGAYPPPGPSYMPGSAVPYPAVSGAPYPPYPTDHTAQPPSYSEAISQPPVQPPPMREGYAKQAPYNTNY